MFATVLLIKKKKKAMNKLVLRVSMYVNCLPSHEKQHSCFKLLKCGSKLLNTSAGPVKHFLYFYFECVLRKKQHN